MDKLGAGREPEPRTVVADSDEEILRDLLIRMTEPESLTQALRLALHR